MAESSHQQKDIVWRVGEKTEGKIVIEIGIRNKQDESVDCAKTAGQNRTLQFLMHF